MKWLTNSISYFMKCPYQAVIKLFAGGVAPAFKMGL